MTDEFTVDDYARLDALLEADPKVVDLILHLGRHSDEELARLGEEDAERGRLKVKQGKALLHLASLRTAGGA